MMGMRMFAEEEKQGTLEMMLTLPIIVDFCSWKVHNGFLAQYDGFVLLTLVCRCVGMVG